MLTVRENHYSGERQPRHGHDETTITLVLSGRLRECVGRREEIAAPLSIVVKPRDTEHANEFGPDVRTLQIVLTEHAARQLEESDPAFRCWRWHHAGPAVGAFLHLLKSLREESGAPPQDYIDAAAIDALAALRDASFSGSTGTPPRWLRDIRQALADAPHDGSVRELASRAQVHPVYLAREFRRWYGHSITEYRTRRRVQRAAELISSSRECLSRLSTEAGFADQPHLCRVFARETGLTPGDYRRLAAS